MAERHDLLALVLPLARSLRRIEDAAAASHGLTMWQYAILATIERRPGRNQADVAALLEYSKNRIIADLDHLQGAGLLVRRRGTDRRSNELAVTAQGRTTRRAIQRAIHRAEDELLQDVSADSVRALRTALTEVATTRST